MPDWDWQLIAALAIVAVAAFVLVRRTVRMLAGSSKAGCGDGGCGSCPSGGSSQSGSKQVPMVTLAVPKTRKQNRREGSPPASTTAPSRPRNPRRSSTEG